MTVGDSFCLLNTCCKTVCVQKMQQTAQVLAPFQCMARATSVRRFLTSTQKYNFVFCFQSIKMADSELLDVVIKWNGTEYPISSLDPEASSIADFRSEIYRLTRVRPSNQKILGIKLAPNQGDDTLVSALKLKKGVKLILMGQPDEVIVGSRYQCTKMIFYSVL